MTTYQDAKDKLRAHAEFVKVQFRSDKPMIRQSINDYAYELSKDYSLSDAKYNLLCNYACKLHPKK